jgi:hypothetical protein
MPKNRILRKYRRLGAAPLADKSLLVVEKMTGNPAFVKPDVDLTLMTTTANQLIAATVTSDGGTPVDTVHRNSLMATVNGQLDTQANYVENIAQNSAEIILSSGYDLASTSHSQALVTGTSITAVTNVASTKLGITVVVDPNAWSYEIQLSTTPGTWVHGGTFTDPHDITLLNLIPGTNYGIRARVHGSVNQVSEWSAPVAQMAT